MRECDCCDREETSGYTYCLECLKDRDADVVEKFWREVCDRAARDGYYNQITGAIVRNYERAAGEIIAEMRRAAELTGAKAGDDQ